MNKKVLLVLGAILLLVGFLKPDLSFLNIDSKPNSVDVMELVAPSDPTLKKECEEITTLLKKSNAKGDVGKLRKLRDLYLDLATLVELDNEDTVIKNTSEIRQANSLSGVMLRLDLKDKYKDLSKELNDVLVVSIGDDDINLSPELRTKSVESFKGLAWAVNESIK